MDTSSIAGIDSWPEVIALLLLVVAVAVVPQIGSWIAAARARDSAERIETSLQRNNGGGSVKDALDRIEAGLGEVRTEQDAQAERLTSVEAWQSAQTEQAEAPSIEPGTGRHRASE